jgi:hypothetical protein
MIIPTKLQLIRYEIIGILLAFVIIGTFYYTLNEHLENNKIYKESNNIKNPLTTLANSFMQNAIKSLSCTGLLILTSSVIIKNFRKIPH